MNDVIEKGVLEKGPFGSFVLHESMLHYMKECQRGRVVVFSEVDDDVWVLTTEQVFAGLLCWNVIYTVLSHWTVSILPYPVNEDMKSENGFQKHSKISQVD